MTTETPPLDLAHALTLRREHLTRAQNPDGGWGYFPGKESWLEPTAYAALALHGQPAAQRALELLVRWQREDGAWRANAKVRDAYWGTALMLTLFHSLGRHDAAYAKGLAWLSNLAGSEGSLSVRLVQRFQARVVDQDESVHGWPWRPGNSSWVEPTSHALIALKQSSRAREFAARIAEGESYLLDRRCADGGWNYGNRRVYYTNMSAFPETTALALMALQGRQASELKPSVERALAQLKSTRSGLARTWLTIALRAHGVAFTPPALGGLAPGGDLAVTALELLAQDAGSRVFQVEKKPS
ncbi:MAG: terpene cyclase/mutase family protein [Bryobacteraceae bacterium]|nr:terpene cyclase/mutase family protein [Bryobacteraceae bacterium]